MCFIKIVCKVGCELFYIDNVVKLPIKCGFITIVIRYTIVAQSINTLSRVMLATKSGEQESLSISCKSVVVQSKDLVI